VHWQRLQDLTFALSPGQPGVTADLKSAFNLQLNTMQSPVLVYKPSAEDQYRVTWYGGESTQLHFEKLWNTFDPDTDATYQEWLDRDVRTLGGGIPTSMKEMLEEMRYYYEDCVDMEIIAMSERM
jgi:hypothetical protein